MSETEFKDIELSLLKVLLSLLGKKNGIKSDQRFVLFVKVPDSESHNLAPFTSFASSDTM